MTPRRKVSLLLAAVFLAGALCGAIGMRIAVHRAVVRLLDQPARSAISQLMVKGIDGAVGLSGEQRREVEGIVARNQAELYQVRRTIAPQLQAGRARQWAEIRQVLSERQRPAFDRLVAGWEARLEPGR